ncbi:hypothetical protein QBC47DRAFT_388696 [Echria macrotheca]|uniref:Uncharacterized protein n=1 Tax=Echria macrotheca TaxID=438768 RepID=A0AAJ0B843_9PEZI|nr:hypothetical protein QBC47DRAFT_388696 [Echria macrotheca]
MAATSDQSPYIFGSSNFTPTPDHRRSADNEWTDADEFIDRCFNFRKYYGGEGSQFDVSEGTSDATPPTLATDTSVDVNDIDEDTAMRDISPPVSESPAYNVIWPQVDKAEEPRSPIIRYPDDSLEMSEHDGPVGLSPSSASPAVLAARPPPAQSHSESSSTAVRTRRVHDTNKTKEVRNIKQCGRCRVMRVSCDLNEVCRHCMKSGEKWPGLDPRSLCKRRRPHEQVTSQFHRWCASGGRGSVVFPAVPEPVPFQVNVHFPRNSINPPLAVDAVLSSESGGGCEIIRPTGLALQSFHQQIVVRARESIGYARNATFPSSIHSLLATLSEAQVLRWAFQTQAQATGHTPMPSNTIQVAEELMENLINMRTMFEIWRVEIFDTRPRFTGMNIPLAAHRFIHAYAGGVISQLEKDILKDIDKLVFQTEIKNGDSPILKAALDVVIWAVLWQLIFLYQEARVAMHRQPQHPKFLETTEELYTDIVNLHACVFRTRKIVETLGEAGTKLFGAHRMLKVAFEDSWTARESFYTTFSGDHLLRSLVIDSELKTLSRRKPAPRRQ